MQIDVNIRLAGADTGDTRWVPIDRYLSRHRNGRGSAKVVFKHSVSG